MFPKSLLGLLSVEMVKNFIVQKTLILMVFIYSYTGNEAVGCFAAVAIYTTDVWTEPSDDCATYSNFFAWKNRDVGLYYNAAPSYK